jgi:hypothetical protein
MESRESQVPSPEDRTPTAYTAEADDLRLEPELGTPLPQPGVASRKRSSPSDDTRPLGETSLTKRPRRKITRTRKAREADGMPAEPDENVPGHAFPRQHLNWRVKDLDSVHLAKDGSIQCTVIWEPTVVAKTDLVGAALHNRCEELFKEAYGQDEWKKWLTTHCASKQRRR